MKLNSKELEYLSAWAREEKANDPYSLPAHQLQAVHQVPSVSLIRVIKAWARTEGRRDEDIFDLPGSATPTWPWASAEESCARLEQLITQVETAGKAK